MQRSYVVMCSMVLIVVKKYRKDIFRFPTTWRRTKFVSVGRSVLLLRGRRSLPRLGVENAQEAFSEWRGSSWIVPYRT